MLHLKHALEENDNKTIIVQSPNTDILILLLTYVHNTGLGNKCHLIKVKGIIKNHELSKLMPFHAYVFQLVGTDAVLFVWQGNIKSIKLLKQNAGFL